MLLLTCVFFLFLNRTNSFGEMKRHSIEIDVVSISADKLFPVFREQFGWNLDTIMIHDQLLQHFFATIHIIYYFE